MLKKLTLGSLFDGSAGFPLGGVISGITPVWASEIEPFPIRVTTKRLPFMKHYGDVSALSGAELPPVDIITFGSPCQDMSIAGKRSGLDGSRSSLFYEAIRIVKEMRFKTNGKYPRFIVWENVPGAFSSNKGEDFRAVLEEVCKIKDECVSVPKPSKWQRAGKILGDGYSVAWRQLDAQFWGVPQRRKRIYLVADFAGWCAGKILFESEGLSGYSPQGFRSWQETANGSAESIGETGSNSLMFENHGQDSRYTGPLEVAQTVLSTFGTGGNNQPFVVQTPKTLKIRSGCEGGGKGALIQEEKSGCLVNGTNPGFQNGVLEADYIVRRLTPTECARLQGFPDWWCDDLGIPEPTDEDIAEWREIFDTHAKALGKETKPKTDAQIRKWLINPHSDSAEYKMWGNGVALPNVVFVLSGIVYYA